MIERAVGLRGEEVRVIGAPRVDAAAGRVIARQTGQREGEQGGEHLEGEHVGAGRRQHQRVVAEAEGAVEHPIAGAQIEDPDQRIHRELQAAMREAGVPQLRLAAGGVQAKTAAVEHEPRAVGGQGAAAVRIGVEPGRHRAERGVADAGAAAGGEEEPGGGHGDEVDGRFGVARIPDVADILSQEELDALLSEMEQEDDDAAEPEAPRASAEIPPSPMDRATPRAEGPEEERNIDLILNLPVLLQVELGRTRMTVHELLQLGQGSVLELHRLASDLIDLTINDHVVAQGEAVVVNENFGFRVVEVDSVRERIRKL